MDRTQKPRIPFGVLPGRSARLRIACDRTAALRARLLTGDAEAAEVTRGRFHLLYWEHQGQQIFPLRDEQKRPHRGDR
ncbi:MAG TPA: hypothetical protein VLH58_10040 [Candidatus Methylomirabilis sp.]|nr:hypothetical protein [Candidatus Methylomirabilis sp.]